MKYIVPSRKHTPLREAYIYTHQNFRFDLSRSIGPVAHTLKITRSPYRGSQSCYEPVYVALTLRILLGHNYPPAWDYAPGQWWLRPIIEPRERDSWWRLWGH